MKFEMKPQDKAFLELAEKVIAGNGSDKDREALKSMFMQNPELKDEFDELQKHLRDEVEAEFWLVAVRVMVGTATPEEMKQIASLKTTDQRKWKKYQDALDFIDALASLHDSLESDEIETMPPHVRKELLRQLSLEQTDVKKRKLR